MRELIVLVLAAVLEVGGDALIRGGLKGGGLKGGGLLLMIAGVGVLGMYGFLVNLTRLDFGHLMGLYIVLFFLASQVIAILIFKEKLQPPTVVGGALIVAAGAVMMFWPK